MKAFLIGLLMTLSTYAAEAQYFLQNNITYRTPMHDTLVKKAGIAEITETYVYIPKRGKHYTSKIIFQYDKDGRATYQCSIQDTLKMKYIQNSTMVNHTTSDNNGSTKTWRYFREESSSILLYDASERVSAYYIYNDRGNLKRSQKVFYKDSLRSRVDTYNKRGQLKSYYLYEYNGKKLKSTGLYNRDGKIIRFWNYNCDDAGVMQKQKDTTTYCTSKTYLNDGGMILTTNYFNEKGEPVKSVNYLDSNNKSTKYLYYVGKNQALVYLSASTYINKQEASNYTKSFTRNGKAVSSTYKVFDAKHQVVSHLDSGWYTKHPFASKKSYTYDAGGLLVETKSYTGERLSTITYYRYRYYKKD